MSLQQGAGASEVRLPSSEARGSRVPHLHPSGRTALRPGPGRKPGAWSCFLPWQASQFLSHSEAGFLQCRACPGECACWDKTLVFTYCRHGRAFVMLSKLPGLAGVTGLRSQFLWRQQALHLPPSCAPLYAPVAGNSPSACVSRRGRLGIHHKSLQGHMEDRICSSTHF